MYNRPYLLLGGLVFVFPPNSSRNTGLLDCLRLFLGATRPSATFLLHGRFLVHGTTTRSITRSQEAHPPLPLKWKNSSASKLQVTSEQDNDSGRQFLFAFGKIFQKGWFVTEENDPIKNIHVFIHHSPPDSSPQFYQDTRVDC